MMSMKKTAVRWLVAALALLAPSLWAQPVPVAKPDPARPGLVSTGSPAPRLPMAQTPNPFRAGGALGGGGKAAMCIREGESCTAPDATCCAGLVCVGSRELFCMPKA